LRITVRALRHVPVWILTILCSLGVVSAIVVTHVEVSAVETAAAEHVEQNDLRQLVANGRKTEAFEEAFEGGDELFETAYNALDGVGANVGQGQRFSSVPRADLRGNGEWFNHRPARFTGPNASSCISCHSRPFDDGAGDPSTAVHRDPLRTGQLSHFIQRDTPPLFGMGGVQRLGEEMTEALQQQRESLRRSVCDRGGANNVALTAKGISFGTLSATRTRGNPCTVTYNTDGVRGVDYELVNGVPELVVRPFQWKGVVASLRDFIRGAAHNELGMQATELVGDRVDGDFDGVVDEFTIGDMTAMSVYLAAQPRPTTLGELASLDLIDPLTPAQTNSIQRGRTVFNQIGCDSCHTPSLTIDNPTFSEPSQNAAFRDGANFPAGQSTTARGVDPSFPVTFNLTSDQPDNVVTRRDGTSVRLGSFARDRNGHAVVEMFSDLRRHEMGPQLAESVNETYGTDVDPNPKNPRNRNTSGTFLTKALWGVGSTAPYLHDGRATTLVEAILEHASPKADDPGEAAPARRRYLALPVADQQALTAFLNSLVLFKVEEQNGVAVATIAPQNVNLHVPRGQVRRRTGRRE
jgi:cytochrome c551/c552